jgi:porin
MKRAHVRFAGALTIASLVALGIPVAVRAQTAPPSAARDLLATYGVIPNLSYTGEFAANPSGGARQGADYAGQLALGADVDLKKLFGLDGGTFHVELTDRSGRDLSNDTINNSVAAQEIYGGGQTFFLTTLTYDQKLFGGVVDIEVGRTEIDQVALQDPIYCKFESNAFCGQPDIMGKIINASFYPVPIWGGHVTIAPTAQTYLLVGLYDSDPSTSLPKYHGFDFSLDDSQGVLIPVELGYQTTFANDAYPRRFDVGAVFDRTNWVRTPAMAARCSMPRPGRWSIART